MVKKQFDLTEQGVQDLQNELQHLKNVKRPENLQNLAEARAQGDLSENADYDAARTEQAQIESRIKEIEHILKNVRLIKATDDNVVSQGKRVRLLFVQQKVEREYDVLGTLQAKASAGRISIESPVGRAIRDHKVGDEVTVTSETGSIFNVKILSISLASAHEKTNS